MAATKLLNLDELALDEVAIVLDKVRHVMRQVTVEEFIHQARAAREAAEKVSEAPAATKLELDEQVAKMCDVLHDAYPTTNLDRLKKLTFPQLNALIEFTFTPPEKIEAQVKAAQAGNV